MSPKKILLSLGILLLIVISGFLRDDVFTKINNALPIRTMTHVADSNSSQQVLILLKWPLTLLFSFLFGTLAWLLIRIIFEKKSFSRFTVLVYGAVTFLSFLIFAIGYLSGKQETCFRVARDIMGLVQSPLLIMILIPAFFLVGKNAGETK